MALKGKEQVSGPGVDDNPQLGLQAEISAAPRARRQARQAEYDAVMDPYLESVKELDDILLKFKKYAMHVQVIRTK